jgi:hypothetical protein
MLILLRQNVYCNVIILNVIILNVIILNVIILNPLNPVAYPVRPASFVAVRFIPCPWDMRLVIFLATSAGLAPAKGWVALRLRPGVCRLFPGAPVETETPTLLSYD